MEEVIRHFLLLLIAGDEMNGVLIGVVQSTQLTRFGSKGPVYGFVTVRAEDKSLVRVKIDAYTEGDAPKVGDRVELEIAPLGQTTIMVVKRIHKIVEAVESGHVGGEVKLLPAPAAPA